MPTSPPLRTATPATIGRLGDAEVTVICQHDTYEMRPGGMLYLRAFDVTEVAVANCYDIEAIIPPRPPHQLLREPLQIHGAAMIVANGEAHLLLDGQVWTAARGVQQR